MKRIIATCAAGALTLVSVLPAAALSNDQQLAAAVEAFRQTAGAGTEEDRKLV